jgi:D-beta-D-heptose 7-phosphate kinase/D-beta-D-heptose 1-phosphate adenosyltransferase
LKVIINGCFDLLHAGHIRLINLALKYSEEGKVLILVNSDESIKELKGEDRPFDDIETRGENIRKVIDSYQIKTKLYPNFKVRIFHSEKELEDIIKDFKPDMVIKGDDRPDVRNIIGYKICPILIIPTLYDKDGDKISTTKKAKEKGLIWKK